jgi:hypothetical protein
VAIQPLLTKDELLRWLDDRAGSWVAASIGVGRDDDRLCDVMCAEGELRRWDPAAKLNAHWDEKVRDGNIGVYAIGDAAIDVTDLDGPVHVATDDDGVDADQLRFQFGDYAELVLTPAPRPTGDEA